MIITAQDLREKGANCGEVERFRKHWPGGAEINEANLLEAAKLGFNLQWFAENFLPLHLQEEFSRQEAPIWDEYNRQLALFLEEYIRQKASLRDEYNRQIALLLARLFKEV